MPRLILISFKWLTLLVCCSIKTLTLHPLVDCGGLSETCTAANCCGVHIHVGTDCSDASTIGGDFGFLICGQLYNASYTCWNHSSCWTYNDVQKRNCLPFHWLMVECESMSKPSKIHLPKKQRTSAFWGLKVSAPLALLFCPNLICPKSINFPIEFYQWTYWSDTRHIISGHYWDSSDYATDPWLTVMHLDDDASRNGVSTIIPGSQAELETLQSLWKVNSVWESW